MRADVSRRIRVLGLALALLAAGPSWADASLPGLPPPGDQSGPALRAYQKALLEPFGGDPRRMPLARKAAHFTWQIERYHRAPWRQVMPRVFLPEGAGEPVRYDYGADISTWNGALLAAMAYEYAVTRAPETLARIVEHLEGLHLFFEVTGQPGLPARCVLESPVPVRRARLRYEAPDGTVYHYRADPAKGTVNQLALGYATLLLVAEADLPPSARRRAREDLGALALHLVHHGYTLRELDGSRTPYGWLRPRFFFRRGVPFNAQVAYAIVAAARAFPPDRGAGRRLLEREYERLRRQHPYWEPLWKPPFLLRPQRVARSRFLGHNDLNHVVNAAYLGILLELEDARREARAPDAKFLRRLGETLRASGSRLGRTRQALGALMWVALLDRAAVRESLGGEEVEKQRPALLEVALEQLRRFPLNRFVWEGRNVWTDRIQWIDAYRPDSYHWKVDPTLAWEDTGGPSPLLISAIDYLHAYWLLRYHGIDTEAPAPTRS